MKGWLVYILLLSFILTNTDLIQVLRIPNLLSHYNEHNNVQNITFRVYLAGHYWDKNHIEDDLDKDNSNSLPFKSIITSVFYIFTPLVLPAVTKLELKRVYAYAPQKVNTYKKIIYLYSFSSSCWNPPKI